MQRAIQRISGGLGLCIMHSMSCISELQGMAARDTLSNIVVTCLWNMADNTEITDPVD